MADFDTPLSLYLKLANAPLNYLLESAVHEKQFGRYSFIGLPMIAISPSEVELLRYNEKYRCIQQHHGNVLDFIDFFSKVLKFQKFRDLNILVADWLDTYTWDMKRFVILKNV